MTNIYGLKETKPKIHPNSFVAEGCHIIGDVELKEYANIWFGSVLRGDIAKIEIGCCSNIQDLSALHTDHHVPCIIGNHVTVGHKAILHGCKIEDHCLIGMGAIILNHAHIAKNSIVAAGTLITERKSFPERSLIMGSPGKVVGEVSDEQIEKMQKNAFHYVENAKIYKQHLRKI